MKRTKTSDHTIKKEEKKGELIAMSRLTFYGLVTDLEKLKQEQEQIQIDLMKLARTYPSLKEDARFQHIEAQIAASLVNFTQILNEYTQLNLAAQFTPELGNMAQEQGFSLIEQAIKELDGEDEATPVQVQAWLIQHHVDFSIEQISGTMQIVRDTLDGEWE